MVCCEKVIRPCCDGRRTDGFGIVLVLFILLVIIIGPFVGF